MTTTAEPIATFTCRAEGCGRSFETNDRRGEHERRVHKLSAAAAKRAEKTAPTPASAPVNGDGEQRGRSLITGLDVREASVCVIISTSRFTVRRAVSKRDVKVEATEEAAGKSEDKETDQDMVAVAKDLIDSEELRAIAGFDHYTKLWVKARSVPSPLLRSAAYLVSVDALPAVYDYLETRKRERDALTKAFRDAYPRLKKAAKERLGPLFNPAEYPREDQLGALFAFGWQVVEIGTPDAKLRTVSRALWEKEKAKAEQAWSNAVGQINEALADGMAKVVEHFASRLGDGAEKPKRFHESSLKKVTDFLDAFGMRNLTKNTQLEELVGQARALLDGVSVKALKGEADTRKRVAAGFAAIKENLDTMLEDRPSRPIAFGDDV